MAVRSYRFGDFKLDCDRFELRRGERSLKLERKPMELLILLAAKNGHLVTRAEIAERLWEQEVFVDTEHGINTAVRKIRQVLRDDSEQPRFVQTVTGKGYRFIGTIEDEAAGGGGAAVLTDAVVAPALEPVSPVELEASRETAEAAGRSPQRWLWVAAVGVVAIAVALLIFVKVRGGRSGVGQIHSLAVLPLDNLTGDPGQNYVADGMTDELTTMLAKSSTLRITSRTSVMQYKGVHRPLPEIARELGVDGVLEGSISRSGDKVHMTIQLIQAPSDTHVWAESYDRAANDLVSLPREAAQAIATRLNVAVPNPSAVRYVSPEAHDAYLRGWYLWFADKTIESGPYFKRATELQPDYALGWSGLAVYYGASTVKGELNPAESMGPLEASAAKALELDDSLPEAHLAEAGAAMVDHWDLVRADRETQRAIELDPKFAEAYHLRAKILAAQSRHAEAIEVQRKGMEIDPFTRPWATVLSLMEARQFDASLKEAKERMVAYPSNTVLLGLVRLLYERKGMAKEAIETQVTIDELNGRPADGEALRRLYREGGMPAVVRWRLDQAKKNAEHQYVSPTSLAFLTAQLGDREGALKLLEEAYRLHATRLLWIQDYPELDILHSDPRYRAIIRGMGLPAAY